MIFLKKDFSPTKPTKSTMFKTPMPKQRLSIENIKKLHALAKAIETDKEPIEIYSAGLRERARNIQIDFNNIITNQDIIVNNIVANNIVANNIVDE